MSDEDLEREIAELEAMQAELQAKIKARKEEVAAKAKMEADLAKSEAERLINERPITVTVDKLTGGFLILRGDFRPDLLAVWHTVPGRAYRGSDASGKGLNAIPIGQWEATKEKLLRLPRLTLQWEKGVEAELEWFLTAPPLEILLGLNKRELIVRPGPGTTNSSNALNRAVGTVVNIQYQWEDRCWHLPLSEGWRLFEVVKDFEGVVWDEDARTTVMADVEQRTRLDLTARETDTDFLDKLPIMKQLEEEGTPVRGFQKVGVKFLSQTGGRMILGDQTGLGKTWQAILYAELMRLEKPNWQTIIVCKASNKPNWEREVKRLTGVTPVICKGGRPDYFEHIVPIMEKRHPYIIINYETLATRLESQREGPDGKPMFELFINADGLEDERPIMDEVYTWVAIIKAAQSDFLVSDEAHYIKNPDAHRSKAVRMLAGIPHVLPMTASPVLNRTEEYWPLLYMVDPIMFKSEQSFLDKYTWNGRQPRNVKELHELLKPRFLRRLKKDVQPDLPPINRITRWMELSLGAQRLYDDALKGVWNLVAAFEADGKDKGQTAIMSILAQITRCKQIAAMDKMDYTADLAVEIQDSNENGGKVLIFSQFKATAAGIAQRLGDGAVCTVRRTQSDFVSMNAIERDHLFESVRNDPKVKYIVTTAATQEGHNLEFCDWVIFNDQLWTPEAHNQCEGRAYGRLANPHAIDSYYVVAEVDIERWIMELLGTKLAIIQTAVEGVESARDTDISIGMELIKRMKNEMWRK